MTDQQFTRCPGCFTVFRVTPQQLEIRAGQVRCGHCKTVFDGNAERVSLAPRPRPTEAALRLDEAALGPPTVTLRDAQALEPALPPPEPAAKRADEEPITEISYDERFAWAKPDKPRRARGPLYAVAIPVLVLALAVQALFHFRDAIAAFWPAAGPALARACGVVGCTISPLRDLAMHSLSIDASDLQADPAHKGLLVLTANVRNHANWPLAYPHLELTLTDAKDDVVVRRALAPAEYTRGTADVANGIAPQAEVPIRLHIDASATTQAGYRLYLFYP
jgi:predicted Zn finger-like uncharacterized protein